MKNYKCMVFSFMAFAAIISAAVLSVFQFKVKRSVCYESPKVSFVVPVYNVEKYLPVCLDSVLRQSLREIEVICVDDGSEDGSLSVLESYRNQDARVKVISQENKGVSAARNAGISQVKGEYIMFLDSDDLISPNLVKVCYENAKKYDSDIVEFEFVKFNDGEEIDVSNISEKVAEFHTKTPDESPYGKLGLNYCTIWNKLWKTSVIKENGLRFTEGVGYNEDLLFNFFAFPVLKNSVVFSGKDTTYFYRKKRSGSITNEIKIISEIENRIKVCKYMVAGAEKMKFNDSGRWMINMLISMAAKKIDLLEDAEKKRYYSGQLLEMIETYAKENAVVLNQENFGQNMVAIEALRVNTK